MSLQNSRAQGVDAPLDDATGTGTGTAQRRCCRLPPLALGAWMRLVVDLGERLKIEVGIDLRAGDARVAKHFLNRAKIAGRLQHMRRERLPQHVRVDVLRQSLLYRPLSQPALDCPRRDSRAAPADEH